MTRDRRPPPRGFVPTLEASLESRALMTARLGSKPESASPLAPVPAQVAPPSTEAPRVASAELVVRGNAVVGISLTFTQPMKRAAVSNVRNYFLYDAGSRGSKLEQALIPLKSASYKPGTATVTLVPARKIDPSGAYLVTNVDVTNPLKSEADIRRAAARQSGFKSLAGVPLNGLGTGTGSFGELVTRSTASGLASAPAK